MNFLKKASDLSKRCAVHSALIAILVVLFLGFESLLFQWISLFVLSFFSLVALWELVEIFKAKEVNLHFWWLAVWVFLWVWVQSGLGIGAMFQDTFSLEFLLLISFFLSTFLLHFRKIEGALFSISGSFFSMIYLAIPIGMMAHILYSPTIDGVSGKMWLIYLVFITKLGDTCAYFGGNYFGGKRLASRISPKKTLAGAIFGVAVPTIVSGFLASFLHIPLPSALFLGFALAFFGILGDLAESLIKRDAAKKDSNVIWGIGGILDLIDSLLFAAPVLTAYLFFRG